MPRTFIDCLRSALGRCTTLRFSLLDSNISANLLQTELRILGHIFDVPRVIKEIPKHPEVFDKSMATISGNKHGNMEKRQFA